MIVRIQTRDENGKFKDANPGDFAMAAFRRIETFNGWIWMRDWLCRFCLERAQDSVGNPSRADGWILRYRRLRDIE